MDDLRTIADFHWERHLCRMSGWLEELEQVIPTFLKMILFF